LPKCFSSMCACCFVLLTWHWGIVAVPGFPRVTRPQTISWGGQFLTLHLNYVAVYTGPLLFLFERTHNYPFDNQWLLPWRLRCLGGSKVRSASLVRVLSDGEISWVLWSQGLWNCPPPTPKQSNTCFFSSRKEKRKPEGKRVVRIWKLLDRDIDKFGLLWEYSQHWLPLPKAAGEPAVWARNCHMNKTAHTIIGATIVMELSGKGAGGWYRRCCGGNTMKKSSEYSNMRGLGGNR